MICSLFGAAGGGANEPAHPGLCSSSPAASFDERVEGEGGVAYPANSGSPSCGHRRCQRTTRTVLPRLPGSATAFERIAPFGEREGLADHRPQPSGVGQLREPGELVSVRLDDEEHRVGSFAPAARSWSGGAPRVTSRPPSRSGPYEPPSTAPPTVSMTTSNPPAAWLGRPASADEAFRAEVPDHGIGAAAGGGNMAAEDRRELDGEHAYSACAPLDQHLLAGLQARVVRQRLPGGQRRQRQRRRATWESDCGLAARPAAGMTTYSAAAPSRSKSIRPTTSSPAPGGDAGAPGPPRCPTSHGRV